MKKLILTTIIVLLTVVGTMAQDAADVTVTADVNAAITLTPVAVAFGTIEADLASFLPANNNDTGTSANIGTDASAGSLQIQGTTDAEVQVSFTGGTLSNGLTGIDEVTASFTASVWLGAAEVTSGSNVTIATGSITLDIGGALAAIDTAGNYSTTGGDSGSPVTFTVQYTGA